MTVTQLTVEVSDDAQAVIADTARATGRTEADVAAEFLTEAARMHRIPGVGFTDGPTGRRATLPSVGIDVFTVVGTFRSSGGDWDALTQAYHWVPKHLLRAALDYADAFPDEIDSRLHDEEAWTQDRIWSMYPFTRPRQRPTA